MFCNILHVYSSINIIFQSAGGVCDFFSIRVQTYACVFLCVCVCVLNFAPNSYKQSGALNNYKRTALYTTRVAGREVGARTGRGAERIEFPAFIMKSKKKIFLAVNSIVLQKSFSIYIKLFLQSVMKKKKNKIIIINKKIYIYFFLLTQ